MWLSRKAAITLWSEPSGARIPRGPQSSCGRSLSPQQAWHLSVRIDVLACHGVRAALV